MANPVSTLQYGNYVFPFSSLQLSSGVIYAPDGFTKIGVRYLFSVSGWVGGVSQGDLNTQITNMQNSLRKPRQNFLVNWQGDGNVNLFDYIFESGPQSGAYQDIEWGPKPGDLEITRFSGGRAAMYRWTLSVNAMDATLNSDVLALTWNWTHSVDASGFTTQTVRGQLLVESGVVQAGQSADHYRSVITSALPALTWFKTEAMEYSQSEDGKVLSFSITQVEQNWTLPSPITNGQVTWMVRVPGLSGDHVLMADYILSGFFESSAAHTKNEIFTAIFNLATLKFGSITGACIIGEHLVREDVYGRNRVEFSFAATGQIGLQAGPSDIAILLTVGLETFGMQPPGSDGSPLKINPYGQTDALSSGSVAFSPILYDATSASVTESGGYQFQNTTQPPNTITYSDSQRQAPGAGGFDAAISGVSKGHLAQPFIAFHEVISYEYDNHLVMLVPKLATADPIVQQTGVPTLKITQAGYSKQASKTTAGLFGANDPAFEAPGFRIAQAYVSTPIAEPISDGSWNLYTTEWRYIFFKTKQPISSDSQLLPFDPRRPGSTNSSLSSGQLPDVIETPE